jgi:hypothetical protein
VLVPSAMPRMAFSPSDIEPASAVTSPSLITSSGTSFQARFTSRNRFRTRLAKTSAGTPRNSEPTFTWLFT